MTPELDNKLCETYPKMFRLRTATVYESCMAWGFDIDDGWYTIIKTLCANIDNHIKWRRTQRALALVYNRALKRALAGDRTGLMRYYSYNLPSHKVIEQDIARAEFKSVPEAIRHITVDQVKEKFGSLRFYYTGGDDVVDGMVRMAESMSAVMCEQCGAPGKLQGKGWLKTRCEQHT
jgi:hypothetical protein